MDANPRTVTSFEDLKDPPTCLVCSTTPRLNADKATCSECGAVVWPTSGSLARACRQSMQIICTDCYAKVNTVIFGGFMHHGQMMPDAIAEKMLLEFELWLQQEKTKNRSAGGAAV